MQDSRSTLAVSKRATGREQIAFAPKVAQGSQLKAHRWLTADCRMFVKQ